MAIYVVMWTLIVGASFLANRSNYKVKYFLFFSFGLMTLVLGMRGANVGEDTKMYLNIAERVTNITWQEIFLSFPTSQWRYISYGGLSGFSEQTETLFLAYCKIIMCVFHNAQAVLFVTAAITNILIAKFILDNLESKSDVIFAVYVYMCDAMFMNSFNTMRQIFALAIAIQSIALLKRKRHVKACICVLVSACFHQSALLFLVADVFYLLKDKNKKYKYLLVAIFILPVSLPIFMKIVSAFSLKYANYLTLSFWGAQLRGTLMLWVLIAVTLIVMIRSKKSNEFDWWLIYMATCYIGIELIGIQLTVVSRVAMYFRIGLVLLFPIAEKYFEKKSGRVYRLGIFAMMTISYISYAHSPARLYTFF